MIKHLFMMIIFGLFFSSDAPFLHGEVFSEKEDSMFINSGEAQYNGKEIVLVGQVVVQHGLGKISARRLTLSNHEKKHKLGFIKINDDVQIELKGGGRIDCQAAEVDYSKMQGIFMGNAEHPDVTYSNKGERSEQSLKEKLPVEVKSSKMTLNLVREPATDLTSSKTIVNQIEADQNVRVNYNQDFILLADHANYQRLPSPDSPSYSGLITFSVDGGHPTCQMTNLNGDRLQAQSIRLDTIKRLLWLDRSQGTLVMKREKAPAENLQFSSDELTWDDQTQTLKLKGNVHITQNETLQVQTEHEISMIRKSINGKRTLQSIHAPKNIRISYLDIKKNNTHHMNCPGPLYIDHNLQTMTLQGAVNASGEVENGQQVYIDDVLGEMYADRIHLNYKWDNRQLIPEKIRLEGHVRLLNRFDGHLEESGSILHYAMADSVDYLPKQQEMMLESANGNRVLFFDKVNNVQMSAPALKVRHDSSTKKQSIQGHGDVRFTFIENEFEKLKQQFRLDESANKETEK